MKRWVYALLALVLLLTAAACNAESHQQEPTGSYNSESKTMDTNDTLPGLLNNNSAIDRGAVMTLLMQPGGGEQMKQVLTRSDSSEGIVPVLLELASQDGGAKDAATYVLVDVWDGKTDPKHRTALVKEVLMPDSSFSHVLYAIALNYSNKDAGSKKLEVEFIKKSIMELPGYANKGFDYNAIKVLIEYYWVDKDAQARQTIIACFSEPKFLQALIAYDTSDLTEQDTVIEIVTAIGSHAITDLLAQQNTQYRMDYGLYRYIRDSPDPAYIDSLLSLAATCPVNHEGMLMDIGELLGYYYKPDDRIVDFYVNLAPLVMHSPNSSLLNGIYEISKNTPAGTYRDAFIGKSPRGFDQDKIAVIDIKKETTKAEPIFSFSVHTFLDVPKAKRLSVQNLYCAKTAIYVEYVYADPLSYTSELGSVMHQPFGASASRITQRRRAARRLP